MHKLACFPGEALNSKEPNERNFSDVLDHLLWLQFAHHIWKVLNVDLNPKGTIIPTTYTEPIWAVPILCCY